MDSRIVISFGRYEVLNLFAICRNHKDIYLSRGFCITFMYLQWALLHCSRCDWWLIDFMGHQIQCHLDCALSILPQLASKLHFWIQPKSGQVWGLSICLAVSKQTQTGSSREGYFTMNGSFCCRIYQPQPNSPQVALCGWSRGPCQSANISLSSKTKK